MIDKTRYLSVFVILIEVEIEIDVRTPMQLNSCQNLLNVRFGFRDYKIRNLVLKI